MWGSSLTAIWITKDAADLASLFPARLLPRLGMKVRCPPKGCSGLLLRCIYHLHGSVPCGALPYRCNAVDGGMEAVVVLPQRVCREDW